MAKQPPTVPYSVGYGSPPAHSRFKPGQSGNLKGRPPKRKAPAPTPAVIDATPSEDLFLTLMRQQIPVVDNGKARQVSRLETVLRSLAAAAAKGDTRAAKVLFDQMLAIEKRQERAEREAVAQLLQMKQDWRELCDERARLGLPRPVRIPDPDDLILDVATGMGRIVGPTTAAEARTWDRREAARDRVRRGVAAVEKAAQECADPLEAETYASELEGWVYWLTLLECSGPDKAVRRQPGFDYDDWAAKAQSRLDGLDIKTLLHVPIPESTAQIFFEACHAGTDIHPRFGEAFVNGLHDIYRKHIDPRRIAALAG